MAGLFITLEGMDGAGKSTHIPTILALLAKSGREVVSTREPGGTPLGEELRELLLHKEMHVETESLLMFAARAEHLQQVILPALARGAIVLSDRFTDASYAYQCGARGLPLAKMQSLEKWVQGDLQPDITLLFDVPVEVSMQRLAGARTPDKFEAQGIEFFSKLRAQYLARAAEFPQRFRVIDANRSLEEVKKSVEEIIISL
ncbi:dTMP kinase [Methylophilus sp. Leaf414]|uniref:dTMP kinase n=1 Tax=Methylophilus sp. Leaf414 TaxID=1736371 RepID=UPI0006F7B017|nr:dTMP kinase [Methylophilus sp. Leaf414]KQT34381.1 thymidylate kinase [Methylophilus sp. Leaf414]